MSDAKKVLGSAVVLAAVGLTGALGIRLAARPVTVRPAIAAAAIAQPIGSCGDIDFNNDGLFPDSRDLDDLQSVMAGGPCSTGDCDSIDFNQDGLTPDSADVDAFVRVLGGGGCRTYVGLDGFTVHELAPDARVVHVSPQGDDALDGATPATAIRTPGRAYLLVRDGHPDHVLFEAGAEWVDQPIANGYGGWDKAGRSSDEPMVFGVYGEGERPKLVLRASGSVLTLMGRDGPDYNGRVAIVGLHLLNDRADPRIAATGLRSFGGGSSILVEDCKIEGFSGGVDFQGVEGIPLRSVTFRRCIVVDSAPGDGHSQGLYFSKVEGLKVEECVVDHCGWTTPETQTIFNHGFYVQPSCTDVLVRDSIVSRSSATGIQLRGQSQSAVGNVVVDNPIGISAGHGQAATPSQDWTGAIAGNLIQGGGDIGREPRGMAVVPVRSSGGRIVGNVVISLEGGAKAAFWLPGDTVAGGGNKSWAFERNLVHEPSGRFWRVDAPQPIPLPAIGVNSLHVDASPTWSSPPRTVDAYAASLGLGDRLGLIQAVRDRARGAWDERLSASSIIPWVTSGYGASHSPDWGTR